MSARALRRSRIGQLVSAFSWGAKEADTMSPRPMCDLCRRWAEGATSVVVDSAALAAIAAMFTAGARAATAAATVVAPWQQQVQQRLRPNMEQQQTASAAVATAADASAITLSSHPTTRGYP